MVKVSDGDGTVLKTPKALCYTMKLLAPAPGPCSMHVTFKVWLHVSDQS